MNSDDLKMEITEEIHVKASLRVTFDALIEQLRAGITGAEDKPMPMKLEAWPGGKWGRDLGQGGGGENGHFWGHVQAIKRPTLLEFCGPLIMSYAATSNLQYRLSEEAGGTLIKFRHSAFGAIQDDHRAGIGQGWARTHARMKERAEAAV
jgi:uncharacterized protein YndB with AHSA1/START domain